MSVLAVARKEINDTRRSKVLWVVVGMFVLFAGGTAILHAQYIAPDADAKTTGWLIRTLHSGPAPLSLVGISPVHVFLPAVGLMLGYRSIVKEQESGQIKLLLSLPHSRADVVVGKLLGRTAVASVAAIIGYAVAALIGLLLYSSFNVLDFAGFTLATLLFLMVYVAIGIAISSASPSTPWAIAGVSVYVVVFHMLWGAVFQLLAGQVPTNPDGSLPEWFILLREVNPARAYNHLVAFLAPEAKTIADAIQEALNASSTSLPDWAFFFVMLFWLVVPMGIGYAIFEYRDI